MSIIMKYLDTRSATIAAIKDYRNMEFILQHTKEEIAEESLRGDGYRSPNWDGMPHAHNPTAGEDRIIAKLDAIQLLKERYRDAVEYMEWYQPAWEMLSEDDRFVLETYYGEENVYGSNAIYAIMKQFGIEQTSAYKKKNRALDRFRLLLFGKG